MSFDQFLLEAHEHTQQSLRHYLSLDTCPSKELSDAIKYSVFNGGKHLRPLLVFATGRSFNTSWENLFAPACAIELIHSYSLIHDDLPAMDNADLRRGKPSCHKAFTEAFAILAGDTLQPLAIQILSRAETLSHEQRIAMIDALCVASGIQGMAAGQALDIKGIQSLDELDAMYRLKTGALLTSCVKLGAIAANAHHSPAMEQLITYAENLGLAFQIQDDLLDLESAAITGKSSGLDKDNNKLTYSHFMTTADAKKIIHALIDQALDAIKAYPLLSQFAAHLLQRKK